MINKNFTKGYALALLSLAEEKEHLLKYKKDAKVIIEVIKANPKFIDLLFLKNINMEEKRQIIEKAFIKINRNIRNLILILINKSRIKWLEKILLKLIAYINQQLNIKEGIIYSVDFLTLIQIKKIENFIADKEQKQVELKNLTDKSLISGIKVVVEDIVIEDNVLSRLEQIKIELLGKV